MATGTYTPLVGDLTPERLTEWRAAVAGVPHAGSARALVRQYLTGHCDLATVLVAVAEFERLGESRARRRSVQVWVGERLPLEDGRVYTDLRVWSPDRGEFAVTARFADRAPRGTAIYHVMTRRGGSDYSEKLGSLVEV